MAAGIVLCGGKSTRMGTSKALLPFGPETMLQRVVRLLSDIVSPIVAVAAAGQESSRAMNAKHADHSKDFVLASKHYPQAPTSRTSRVVTCRCSSLASSRKCSISRAVTTSP
jgi:CTP:molybdopterin cytidylyltransferase MocA